jgi:hypothetical protein
MRRACCGGGEAVRLVADDALGLCVFGACVFDEGAGLSAVLEVVHEGNRGVVIEEGWVTFFVQWACGVVAQCMGCVSVVGE